MQEENWGDIEKVFHDKKMLSLYGRDDNHIIGNS